MRTPPVGPLYVFLAGAIGCLLLFQTSVLPAYSRDIAVANPGFAWVRPPLLTVSILVLACAQLVLVATWRLLTLETGGTVFTPRAYPWVDTIIVALIAAVALSGCAAIWLAGAGAGHPGVVLSLLAVAACAGAGAVLMRVMRSMLVRATEQRHELAGVV